MPGRYFRILTPDGSLTQDRFVLPPRQPRGLVTGCLMVLHERTGATLTVHDTRLFPAEAANLLPLAGQPHEVCHRCGHVAGLVDDNVRCMAADRNECGMQLSTRCLPAR